MNAPVGQGISGRPTHVTAERFFGQSIIVTGAAQGIGLAVAHRIAYEDGNLVLVDRSELVHEVAEQLRGVGKGTVDSVTADLETYEGAQQSIEFARTKFKNLDIVINNVGGTIWAKPFEEYTEEEITKEIQRSLFPTLWMCRATLPCLIKNGGGTIVNVSSIATGGVNRVPYAAAKGGVNGIVSALAHEAAHHNVRVVATAPGGTLAPERKVKRGPLRHPGGTGRTDLFPRLGGSLLHHRQRAARGWRRPGLGHPRLDSVRTFTGHPSGMTSGGATSRARI